MLRARLRRGRAGVWRGVVSAGRAQGGARAFRARTLSVSIGKSASFWTTEPTQEATKIEPNSAAPPGPADEAASALESRAGNSAARNRPASI